MSAADDFNQGAVLSSSRAIVAALKALQTRVEEVEAARRCETEQAQERFDAKCQELQKARAQIESLKSKFELERQHLEKHCEEIKQQRDKALADLAISKHTINSLRDEIKMTKSLMTAMPSTNRSPKVSAVDNESIAPSQQSPTVERNIEIVMPSVKESPPSTAKEEQKVDELERLVYNLLQMNSKLKEERDTVRKQLKLNLGTTRSTRPISSGTSAPSFAQPRSRIRPALTSSTLKRSQSKIKENKEPVNRPEPESVRRKRSKLKTRPANESQVTESKLRWIQHCIDEIAKTGGINLKTGSSNFRNRKYGSEK